ncbi:Uncharacterised protein [Segatella copri]|nr:Uncharacterised protein [Segatella copri]
MSSYTTFRQTSPLFSFWFLTRKARLIRLSAYSGYFTGMRIFSSLAFLVSSASGSSLSRRIIFLELQSVSIEEMTQVQRIIITTPFSMSSLTR